jgi:hypothetical protein
MKNNLPPALREALDAPSFNENGLPLALTECDDHIRIDRARAMAAALRWAASQVVGNVDTHIDLHLQADALELEAEL